MQNKSLSSQRKLMKRIKGDRSKSDSLIQLLEMKKKKPITLNPKIIKDKTKFDKSERNIPKLRFIDFLMNNIYCQKCCNASNRQQIISSCNNLVSKYYTIEDIIYNQMKLENLLKDYKWNDPNLKYIENNEFIVQLKSYYNI